MGAQTHAGSHVASEVATCRMNRQSVAVGSSPLLIGCAQSALGGVVEDVELELEEVEPIPISLVTVSLAALVTAAGTAAGVVGSEARPDAAGPVTARTVASIA